MRIAIFTADSNGAYPIPAVKGGAVQELVGYIVKENDSRRKIELTICSFYDREADLKSLEYPNVDFHWIKVPSFIRVMDDLLFFVVSRFFKRIKAISYRSVFSLVFYIIKSSCWLKHHHYDGVILENNIPLAWIIKLSKYKGKKYYHFHNEPRVNVFCEDVFKQCTALCVSQYIANCLSKGKTAIKSISKELTLVLNNCVDIQKFNKNYDRKILRNKWHLDESDNVIIFVGRFSPEKGIDKLLEAIPFAKTSNLKVLLVGSLIYGSKIKDSYLERLEQLSKICGDKVVFTGYISHDELSELYNVSDIAVIPSVWNDPAPLTNIEAMACGVPVITTQSGGIPEYVADCGFVLPINDDLPRNIAEKIDLLFSDVELRKSLSAKAVKRVEENFTTEKYYENFCDILKS